jgi:hypothetical protein
MASKKISQLTTGSINPPLSAVVPIVYSGETFQQELSTLRETLVDSGSHEFNGDQKFIGNIEVEGSVSQAIESFNLGEEINFIKINNTTIGDENYNKINFQFKNGSDTQIDPLNINSFIINYLDSDEEKYGTKFSINGKNFDFLLKSSKTNRGTRFILKENEDGSTIGGFFADEIRIGCGPQSCSSGLTIGNVNASFIKIISQDNHIGGDTTITGSLNVSEVINLKPLDVLPIGSVGDLAVSGSKLYFNNGEWVPIV